MESVSDAIVRLGRESQTSGSDAVRDAARETGGLPVLSDMGGVLVLMPTMQIRHYDPETGTSSPLGDPKWHQVALMKAARSHPELEMLMPSRPAEAVSCSQCEASGRMFDRADCGLCMGAGRVVPAS
jgi:hypothetical protein